MLLDVGYITRPHGLRGEVLVALTTDRHERLDVGTVLQSDRGPLTVEASRIHQDRWIVQFTGIADRTRAEAMAGTVLRAEPLEDPDALWVHELIGARVVESDGTDRGRIAEIEANPAHDLLVLESGALVPMVFVVAFADGVATIEPPAGLFE